MGTEPGLESCMHKERERNGTERKGKGIGDYLGWVGSDRHSTSTGTDGASGTILS